MALLEAGVFKKIIMFDFDYKIIIYIFFGVLPSLIWLSYYLRKDVHPEPNKVVIRIFLWGALITIPVFFVQIGLMYLLSKISVGPLVYNLIYWFLIIAMSEELFKYFVIREKIINNSVMDEPVDVMLYMVIAALGFAALENILYLFGPIGGLSFNDLIARTLLLSFVRFVGATFLHTLCSGVIGYSLAISFHDSVRRRTEIFLGIVIAILLHGFYDFSIIMLEGQLRVIAPIAVLIILAILVFYGFERLKKMKSVTLLKT